MSNPNMESKVKELMELRRMKEEIEAEITAAEDEIKAVMGDEEAAEAIEDLSRIVKEEINYIFNADVADIVFDGASPLSTRKGVPLYERFVNAMFPVIQKDIEAETKESSKRISKYTDKAQQVKRSARR